MNLQFTTKENGLLKDAKGQEELCIRKYDDYAARAKCPALASLFREMADTERSHLSTITEMMSGTVTPVSGPLTGKNNDFCTPFSYASPEDKQADCFLCQDMLASEKHASALYDTSVFEFESPVARKVLNHIQAEEQQHGEQLYAFMKANGMYQ
jgi:rubrerythrin